MHIIEGENNTYKETNKRKYVINEEKKITIKYM